MLKHIYRIVACVIVFIAAMFYFSHNIREKNNEKVQIETVEMEKVSFPVVQVKQGAYVVNTLHGYETSLDVTTIRDGVVPVGDDNKLSMTVLVDELNVTRGTIEIFDIVEGKSIESNDLGNFQRDNDKINIVYTLTGSYQEGAEYVATITLVSQKGDKLKYYTRFKKTDVSHFKEIMSYALEFHKDVLNKDTASNVVTHIEPDNSMSNTDLAYVNINSSLHLISYGDLAPKVVSGVFPKVHEVTEDTSIIELEFYVQAQTGYGTESYKVDESFRIRWTSTRMYLLGYDRTMESVFDPSLVSIAQNEFKLGITNNTQADYVVTPDESKIAFVRNGDLWYYNTATNDVVSVLSFNQEDTDYIRDIYNNHNVKILDMDELGNLDFIVYGYMNRGNYEGREGIILYKYYSMDSRIEERLYIPMDIPYNLLDNYVSDFAYVNAHDVFFFAIDGTIYSYDMITDKLSFIATDLDETMMRMSSEGNFMAWMDSSKEDANINIMNLETDEKTVISPKENTCIKLLGTLGESVIYGYANFDDEGNTADGSKVLPISLIHIVDANGDVQKEYIPNGCYITTASIEGNKVKINQVKKDANGHFVPSGEDYIFNADAKEENVKTSFRLTDLTMTEWYMSIPDTTDINKAPGSSKAVITVDNSDNNAIVRIDLDTKSKDVYYTYAYHGLELISENAGDAVVLADKKMGMVYDNQGTLIWERGTKKDGESVNVDLVIDYDSVIACMKMLIASDGVTILPDEDLSLGGLTITQKLSNYLNHKPINLTGASLSQMFYYINQGHPVMAMKNSSASVLIIAYSNKMIRYIDSDGLIKIETVKNASKVFEDVGNVFITYV